MQNVIVTFVPSQKLHEGGQRSRTYPFVAGLPLPGIGELVSFEDPFHTYKVMNRSFRFADVQTLEVFLGIDAT